MTIGATNVWRVSEARSEARKLRQLVDRGGDPLGDLQASRDAPTMAELIERFQDEHLPRMRPRTAVNYNSLIRLHVLPAFKHLKAAEVAFSDIDALHRKLTKAGFPYLANRCIAVVSKMFSLSIKWGVRTDNPCRGVERNYEVKRKRYLSSEELPRLMEALAAAPDQQAADVVRLLLLCGCRKSEALSARWADLDLAAGIWSKPASAVVARLKSALADDWSLRLVEDEERP